MEKFVSFIILLFAAALLAPGCMAEGTTAADAAGVLNSVGTAQNIGLFNDANMTTTVEEVSILEPVTGVKNSTEVVIEPMANATMTADVNTTNLSVKLNDTILISLKENPTTGYSWNVTNSTGIEIVGDEFLSPDVEGMVGVGGVHEWTVKAVAVGNQTFEAVYMRSWEPITGEEETYTLNVVVEEATEEVVKETVGKITTEPVNETPLVNAVAKNSVI